MKIKIFAISDWDKHFQNSINEYQKRMSKEIQIFNIKPQKNWEIEKIKKKDTEKIIEKLKKHSWRKILLSLWWEDVDTYKFKKILNTPSEYIFVIWGAYWMKEKLLSPYIEKKIKLSSLTLAHWLSKVVLLEQLFRIKTLFEWRSYHY